MRSVIVEDPEWTQLMDAETSGDCINDAFLQLEFNKIAASYMGTKDHHLDDVSLDELLTTNSGGDGPSKTIRLFAGARRDRRKAWIPLQPSASADFLAKRGRTVQTNGSPKKQQRRATAKQ
uniref:Uncharacterized protein n=1 Tax=Schistocephalus solidus TaxID=70667 RepID=A0A0X3PCR4_SCHSO